MAAAGREEAVVVGKDASGRYTQPIVVATIEGLEALLEPIHSASAAARKQQQHIVALVEKGSSQQSGVEKELDNLEDVFGRLPAYTHKLQLLRRNMEILEENVAKTKALALKIQTEVNSTHK